MNATPVTEIAQSSAGQRFTPRDRESFFDAQARNRHATWRMSALCVLGAALMGIPLALIITPLLFGVMLIVADVVNLFSPLPQAFWNQANDIARVGLVALGWLLEQKPADPQLLAAGAAVMLVPGMFVSLSLWLAVDLMFRRSSTGGALLALKARQPNQAELKELQLADIAQEMAIAAGLPAPKLTLIDSPAANAAVIGSSPKDARIVVTRGLIDLLSRDELEGMLAHLIASIGNGDLRIASRMTSIFQACGLLMAIMNAPFGPQSRRTLARMVRYWFSAAKHDPQEAAAVADLLTRSADPDTDDIDRFFDPTVKRSRLRSIRNFIFFPIFFTNTAVKLLLWFFSGAVLGPSLALLWRTRQYLADASAVQLTRDPDSLARALQKVNQEPGTIPGGDWASHLFVVSPKRGGRSDSASFSAQQRQILAQAWAASAPDVGGARTPGDSPDFAQISRQFSGTIRAAFAGDANAVERLRSLYRNVAAADPALAAQFPNPDDLMAAQQGDVESIQRLRGMRRATRTQNRSQDNEGSGSNSLDSFVDFHPPLKRRLKRLARMGAHVNLAGQKPNARVFVLILSLVLGPLALLVISLFLLLIAVMTLASFAFLAIWLAVIHKVFALFGSPVSS
jgi:Zn-dependent protease with chaperone function